MPLIGVGGSTFSGGTLTSGLTLSPSNKDAVALKIRPVAGASTDGTNEIEVYDDTGTVLFLSVDADGNFRFRADNSFGNDLRVTNNASLSVLLDGSGLNVYDGAGNTILAVARGVGIGLYGHAAAAQSSVTSGTVTPEGLALALQGNGTLGGT